MGAESAGLAHRSNKSHSPKNKTILASLKCINRKQKRIFAGYYLMNICTQFNEQDQSKIPVEIIDLCLKFYYIDILEILYLSSSSNSEIESKTKYEIRFKTTHAAIIELANQCINNDEYLLAYEIHKLYINGSNRHRRNRATYYVAHMLYALKDYKQSELVWKKVIKSKMKWNPSMHVIYGQLFEAQHRYSLAVEQFKTAVKLYETDPVKYAKNHEHSQVYFKYAKALRDYTDDYKKSKKYYLKGLEMNNKSHNASYGYLLYLMGDYQSALKYIEIELKENGVNSWSHYYRALVNDALDNQKDVEGDLVKAIDSFKQKDDDERRQIMHHLNIMKRSKNINVQFHLRFLQGFNLWFLN